MPQKEPDDNVVTHRWSIAPCFIVDDVVTTANYQMYGCRDFDVEDCNGYRLCFGQDTES